ncbi:MAG: pentapeptide repeat-containing protein, partial [Neisseriaceae bacterium]
MNIIDVAPIYVKKLNRLIKNKNQSSLNSQNDKEFKHILHILNRFIGLDALEMLIKGKSLEYICKGNIFLIDILKDKYTNLLEEKAQFCTETFLVKKYRNIVSDFNKLNIFNSTGLTRAKAKLLLDNYVLNNEKLDLKDTTFSGADLSGLDLSDIDFSGAKFYKTILINVNLSNSIFTWANLTSANLTGANLNGVNLNLCGLNGAN